MHIKTIGMHDTGFQLICLIISADTYVYFFPTPYCRDHQVSSVVNWCTVLLCRLLKNSVFIPHEEEEKYSFTLSFSITSTHSGLHCSSECLDCFRNTCLLMSWQIFVYDEATRNLQKKKKKKERKHFFCCFCGVVRLSKKAQIKDVNIKGRLNS